MILPLVSACAALVCAATPAFSADSGYITYSARVVHNNRAHVSYVSGVVDEAAGDFAELVERSFTLNWQRLPGRMQDSRPALPAVWRAAGRTAHRYSGAPPRYDGELLRHFILGHIIDGVNELEVNQQFLSGQLIIGSVEEDDGGFEVVTSFRGMPLVIVGRYTTQAGRRLPADFAVLGPASELYQYFFDEITYHPGTIPQPVSLPSFNPADYVNFPAGGAQPVAIRPVKDWLVFQAQLPSGRPLNLVFDSGAETMILDEWVLTLDSGLEPVGELPVAGGLATGTMELYEGFDFIIGGVEFSNLSVVGTQLTMLGLGADMRIHGVVGGDILRLAQVDIDLTAGQLALHPLDDSLPPEGEGIPLTLIQELPHIQASVHGTEQALLLLDTGQRTSLQVNLDYLDAYQLGDELMMNGFLGDVAGGLMPRYIIEKLDVELGGERYTEAVVDASLDSTYSYNGLPVAGAIGFPLLARHFGGITFDYHRRRVYLRDPGENLTFLGRPEAWDELKLPAVRRTSPWQRKDGGEVVASAGQQAETPLAADSGNADPRRPELKLRETVEGGGALVRGWADYATEDTDPLESVRASAPESGGDQPDSVHLRDYSVFPFMQELADAAEDAGLIDPLEPMGPVQDAPAPEPEPQPALAAAPGEDALVAQAVAAAELAADWLARVKLAGLGQPPAGEEDEQDEPAAPPHWQREYKDEDGDGFADGAPPLEFRNPPRTE